MKKIDEKIQKYFAKHHLLTLAVCSEKSPYCASCFYAYESCGAVLVFASDIETRHMQEALKNPNVAGTISKETKNIGKIQGIQFTGQLQNSITKEQKECYFKKFPFAKVANPILWTIELEFIKMTDNTMGFGKKIVWQKSSTKT
ncbi:pyridoxamine 5'-phosphate oxidase family protein [Nitrosophilus alvini]|uniref:pyridoxamine 5'-phosphate oxidase family protein n=1 Tax=Nitrosophilus alvini TaxID=2714855 RepID=UPI00190E18E7|nr:pyridoxamine 5'-phosphate oxidase family protein [Nitrosophilus alvini]